MKRICKVMKCLFGGLSIVSFICVCSVDDTADGWISTLIVSFIITILSTLLLALFDKLSQIELVLPDKVIYVMATIFELFRMLTNRRNKQSYSRRCRNTHANIINISDYISVDKNYFTYEEMRNCK